ncbi:O-methyltransferase [Akanthomyces lecanii RCEF 1005]|uniref:O-methyltransferase n=1 Tax=Akanthomyces lecanii RCEF 1005 TaxID=1081108 RepID=A0A168BK08_CORDF|nr:O-methyltransferase [Akanthomyces lecanii RCEF 1005]
MTTTAVVEGSRQTIPIRFDNEQCHEAESTTSDIVHPSPPKDSRYEESVSSPTQESQEKTLVVTPVHTYLYNMIELGVVRALFDRHVFEAIPVDGDISIEDLAVRTGVEVTLLNRFIQFLALAKRLASPALGRMAHTQKSRVFLYPEAVNFLSLDVDFFMGPATRWSGYFEANGWKEPQSSTRTPLGLCYSHPDKSIYDVMLLLPGKRAAIFNAAMADTINEMKIVGYYDFSWIAKHVENDSKRTLIVDVGGGKGQALKAIIQESPAIPPQRCVLHDQATAINEAISEEDAIIKDIPKVVSSFFEPQLIKGSLVYHIRRILNDYPDKEAREILQHCRDACADDSTVLVSEQILPNTPSLDLAAMDIFMLNYGGKRRTRAMFEELTGSAGFKVARVAADNASGQAIIEMVPV